MYWEMKKNVNLAYFRIIQQFVFQPHTNKQQASILKEYVCQKLLKSDTV